MNENFEIHPDLINGHNGSTEVYWLDFPFSNLNLSLESIDVKLYIILNIVQYK